VDRLEGSADAAETPIGLTPLPADLDLSGLDISPAALKLLLEVDTAVWREEAALIGPHYETFADRLPQGLWDEHAALIARLEAASEA